MKASYRNSPRISIVIDKDKAKDLTVEQKTPRKNIKDTSPRQSMRLKNLKALANRRKSIRDKEAIAEKLIEDQLQDKINLLAVAPKIR